MLVTVTNIAGMTGSSEQKKKNHPYALTCSLITFMPSLTMGVAIGHSSMSKILRFPACKNPMLTGWTMPADWCLGFCASK